MQPEFNCTDQAKVDQRSTQRSIRSKGKCEYKAVRHESSQLVLVHNQNKEKRVQVNQIKLRTSSGRWTLVHTTPGISTRHQDRSG